MMDEIRASWSCLLRKSGPAWGSHRKSPRSISASKKNHGLRFEGITQNRICKEIAIQRPKTGKFDYLGPPNHSAHSIAFAFFTDDGFEERNRLTSAEAGKQRYVVTSIVMLVQYSGNRDDCCSESAASNLLAASAFGVTIRSIVAAYASLVS